MTKPYVKNVADPEQVKEAKRKETWNKKVEKEDVAYLMKQPEFRRYLWRLASFCGVFEEVWHPSALIHKLAGMQYVGQVALKQAKGADIESFFKMWRENDQEMNEDDD